MSVFHETLREIAIIAVCCAAALLPSIAVYKRWFG